MDKERFSLLLLEPGEIYFEDLSVFFCSEATTRNRQIEDGNNQLGRLKICSKSLVFDPKDIAKPLIKIPLKECSEIKKHDDNHYKWLPSSVQNVLTITCNQYVEMLEGNILAPYSFKNQKRVFIFVLNYANVDVCVRQISQLHRASTLPFRDQNEMIAAIEQARQIRIEFDPLWFEDLSERVVLETTGNRITPLVVNPGRIVLSNLSLYFQPFNKIEPHIYLKIPLNEIKSVTKRRFLLQQVGLELCCRDVPSVVKYLYVVLKSAGDRDRLYSILMSQPKLELDDSDQERVTLLWQNGVLSNYDYLLFLNSLADRTFNDLTQYPVFPWVIADYTSNNLDLNNESSFRDLTKPIGALNEERLKRLMERYEEMPNPRFLYGSHYSTPGFVLFYLVRKYPHYMLCLQNGRFDHPDRMFNSIPDVWRNVLTNMSDFKELVPEFYDLKTEGDFLNNSLGIHFGFRQNGARVCDVVLPPWAKDAKDFVNKLRDALESDYVSTNLHHWIDLIFGYKQIDKEAEKAHNLFFYLCYEGAVNLDSINDCSQRHALEVQIMEFGQIPKQIFTKPHPQRSCLCNPTKSLVSQLGDVKGNFSLDRKLKVGTHKEGVTALALVQENDATINVMSVGRDGILKVHSVMGQESSQQRSAVLSSANMPLSSIIVLPEANTLIVGCWDSSISVYIVDSGRVVDQIVGHEDAISSLVWGSKKNWLVSGSWDCCVRLWKVQDTNPYKPLNLASDLVASLEHDSRVTTVAIDRDNKLIASGTDEGEVLLWSSETFTLLQKFTDHSGCVNGISFNPDGTKLISCSDDARFKVYDISTGMQVFSKTLDQELKCLCLSDAVFFVGGSQGSLFVWDLLEMTLLQQIQAHQGSILSVCVINEGSTLAVTTGGDDHKIFMWQTSK